MKTVTLYTLNSEKGLIDQSQRLVAYHQAKHPDTEMGFILKDRKSIDSLKREHRMADALMHMPLGKPIATIFGKKIYAEVTIAGEEA